METEKEQSKYMREEYEKIVYYLYDKACYYLDG